MLLFICKENIEKVFTAFAISLLSAELHQTVMIFLERNFFSIFEILSSKLN